MLCHNNCVSHVNRCGYLKRTDVFALSMFSCQTVQPPSSTDTSTMMHGIAIERGANSHCHEVGGETASGGKDDAPARRCEVDDKMSRFSDGIWEPLDPWHFLDRVELGAVGQTCRKSNELVDNNTPFFSRRDAGERPISIVTGASGKVRSEPSLICLSLRR